MSRTLMTHRPNQTEPQRFQKRFCSALLCSIACAAILLPLESPLLAQTLTGGYQPANVNDPMVVDAAKYLIRQVEQQDQTTVQLKSIDNAETQVVAGTNVRLRMRVTLNHNAPGFLSGVVYIPFNGRKQLATRGWEPEFVNNKQQALLPGYQKADRFSPAVHSAANFAITFLRHQPPQRRYDILEVRQAGKRGNGPTDYYLDLLLQDPNKPHTESMQLTITDFGNSNVDIGDSYGNLNVIKLDSNLAPNNPGSNPAQPLGGSQLVPVNDALVVAAAHFAVAQLSNTYGEHVRLQQVLKATSQVVAGTNYGLRLRVISDRNHTLDYDVVVYLRPDGTRELTSHQPVQ